MIIVRHGRTAWNREVRFRGRMDLPLDEVGQAQARAAARAILVRWDAVAAIYSSPLLRARQTAEPIAEALGLPVQVHWGLLDLDYGEWTGLTPADAEARDPDVYHLWQTRPQQAQFPGGESLADVQGRLLHLLEEADQIHTGQRIVLVGHLVVNRVLLCILLEAGLETYWRLAQDPAAINLAHYEDGVGRILCLNDTCHLLDTGIQGGTNV